MADSEKDENLKGSNDGSVSNGKENPGSSQAQDHTESNAESHSGKISKTQKSNRRRKSRDIVELLTPYFIQKGSWATKAIIAINILLFIALGILTEGKGVIGPSVQVLIDWGADYGPVSLCGEPWRIITSTFLHIGLTHILVNMWALYDLGTAAERLFGTKWFVILYLMAGIGGSCISLLYCPSIVSAGASGAIFGLYGALMAFLIANRKLFDEKEFLIGTKSATIFIIYSLILGIFFGFDNAAHLGGLATGFGCGQLFIFIKNSDNSNRKILAKILAPVLLAVIFGLATLTPFDFSGDFKYFRAWLLYEESRFQESLAMFDKFIKQRPSDFKGYEGRAFVLLHLDRSKDALETYSDLLAVDPNNSECLNLRANLNIKLGNFSNALDDAIKAAKIDPSESVLSTLVQAKVQVSEYEDALTVCKVLIKKAGDNEATYHLDFARILRLMNKQQQAIKTLEEVIKSDQKNPDAYYQLAVTHTELGEVDKAKSDLNILSTIQSDDCHLYSKSGLIKLILGVNDGAFEDGVNCFDLAESGDSYERYGFIVKLLAARGVRSEHISKRLAIEYKSFYNREQWPGPIVSYLTDEISLNELMKQADTNSKMTDALAYAGLNKIFLGDEKVGLELLQKVEKHGNKYSPEFEAARAFLKMNNRKQ